MGTSRRSRPELLLSLALVAVVAVLYGRIAWHGFVDLDDGPYVFDNANVREGLTAKGLAWAFTSGEHGANWHPLTSLSHMLDCEMFGLEPGGHHLVSVALHAASAVLLFLALRSMTGQPWLSVFVAALFAVHPLRVESVAWVSERKDVLSGLFFMLVLLAYAWYARRPSAARYASVFVALALGLMSKPMLVSAPFVLLLLDVWPLGRLDVFGETRGRREARRPWLVLLEKLPLLALCGASVAITLWAQGRSGAVGSYTQYPLAARAANALVSYVAYLGKTVWPSGLAVFYPHAALVSPAELSPTSPRVLGSALVMLVATAIACASVRRRPYVTVGWLWYAGMLLPVIGIVQVGTQAWADRYAYLPLVGIYVIAAWAAREAAARWISLKPLLAPAAIVTIAAYSAVTWVQIDPWKDSVALYRHALAVTKNNYLIHNNLGVLLDYSGDTAGAREQYERALAAFPDHAEARENLGALLFRTGDLQGALENLHRAVELAPNSSEAHNDLGAALFRSGDLEGAISRLERSLSLDPDNALAHYNLGAALLRRGESMRAAGHFEQALRINPQFAAAREQLARARADAPEFVP